MSDTPTTPENPRDLAARWWRPFGFWALTVHVAFGPPVLVYMHFWHPDVDVNPFITLYGTLLAAWTACAGIRQWGKNRGSEPMSAPRGYEYEGEE